MGCLIARQLEPPHSIAIEATDSVHITTAIKRLSPAQQRWLSESGFKPQPGQHALLADADGKLNRVMVGVDANEPLTALASLPYLLPEGCYHLASEGLALDETLSALGWALAAYRFTRYRPAHRAPATLAIDAHLLAIVTPLVTATYMVRDLVNTPTEDLGPEQLANVVRELSQSHKAQYAEWVGEDLRKANFPAIHAVGRASHRAPRLIELTWGEPAAPQLAILGKGVCFDTGGLNLKPADGMRWMKKDMGGAAHAIALAFLVMQAQLPVRLSLLIPAVENAVAGNALRPGEVIVTRSGVTVEVDNTDAEGRLILGDTLSYAAEQQPDLLIDFATLTGAARVALGPDLPALFTNRSILAQPILDAGQQKADPLWQLPLWRPYQRLLYSYLADLANSGASRHAGAITAVPADIPWVHLDTYAWNDSDRPGRPYGGEAQGVRALFAFLQQRYGT
jgi:leucyl aminopeptidase